MYKKFKNEKWKEYYNSFFYSCYIFDSVIVFDDVRNDKQYLIEYNKKIYEVIENYNLIKSTHRKENDETLEELINIFNNVDKKKIYKFNELFQF